MIKRSAHIFIRITLIILAVWISIPCALRRETKRLVGVPVAAVQFSKPAVVCAVAVANEKKNVQVARISTYYATVAVGVFRAYSVMPLQSRATQSPEHCPVFLRNRCLRI
jgi:hypothetical protein